MFNVGENPEKLLRCNSFVALGVGGTIAAIAAVATVAGISYTIYSAENPPKTPQQATTALNASQNKLAKLQAKLSEAQAAGKDTSKISTAIGKLQSSVTFLNQWIAQYGNTLAPKTPDGNFASITNPLGNKTNSGAPQPVTQNKSWMLIAGIVGAVFAIGFLVYMAVSKKKIA